MNFEIISTDEHSHCDFGTLLKFDTMENAQQAVGIIVNQPYACDKLADGYSGAFRVDTYVMFNVYSESAYFNLIKELRDAAPVAPKEPAGGPQAVLYDILADRKPGQKINERTRRVEARRIDKLAARFIAENIPGATYIEHETYYEDPTRWIEAWFEYEGKQFHVDFCLEDGREWLNLWSTNLSDGYNVDVSVVTPDSIKDAIASMDSDGRFPDGRFQPDETVKTCASEEIFDILNSDIDTQKDYDKQQEALHGLAAEYLAANFPEAVFTGTSIDIEEDRKILKIAFSYGVPGFEIRFKLWNSGLKSVWLGLDDSSRKVTEHWKLKTIADELIGETVGKTTKEPAPEPANEPSADARIAALEKDVAYLKDAVAKLLKK